MLNKIITILIIILLMTGSISNAVVYDRIKIYSIYNGEDGYYEFSQTFLNSTDIQDFNGEYTTWCTDYYDLYARVFNDPCSIGYIPLSFKTNIENQQLFDYPNWCKWGKNSTYAFSISNAFSDAGVKSIKEVADSWNTINSLNMCFLFNGYRPKEDYNDDQFYNTNGLNEIKKTYNSFMPSAFTMYQTVSPTGEQLESDIFINIQNEINWSNEFICPDSPDYYSVKRAISHEFAHIAGLGEFNSYYDCNIPKNPPKYLSIMTGGVGQSTYFPSINDLVEVKKIRSA